MSSNDYIEKDTDIVIIGAGAAGMMAAHFCSLGGKEVFLLDHNKEVGRKILISGGGKCNFTNLYGSDPKDYYCENPHFVKSALSRYSPWEFIDLIIKNEIPYEQRLHGQLFCKRSAKDINKVLLSQLKKPNIKLLLERKDLQVEKTEDGFKVFNELTVLNTKKLIIATGGLVLPQIGASDFGHVLAKRFGHKIIPMVPALVPFKIDGFSTLAGNAFIAGITCNGHYVAENVLFTHKGLSGPGILKTSLFWHHGDPIEVNWLPGQNIEQILLDTPGSSRVDNILKKFLPNKFVDVFFERICVDGKLNIGRLSKKDRTKIHNELHHMKIIPQGTEGFRKAEVTRGGVCTSKISSKTMESQLCPGLHFIGEVLDVTGQLGGHNFQWCWASAHAVGQALK
ncbi:MAG: NAD(P)/FAD-dependent oxidoreductase [Bacteriovoracaceae bacterium]|jgi:predicted Rossmann fold flavoprotein|nr:NAD(P)/FAD-dependent oxidoreductase [Bacteriovoracaceae bacterium]